VFNSFRHFSWIISIAFHVLVLVGGAYLSTGSHVKIDLNKRTYAVDLVGAPNKGKAGAKGAPKPVAQQQEAAQKKAPAKEAPETKPTPPEQKKPEVKPAPAETAKAIPLDTANATKVAEAKPAEPKKEEPKKEPPKKEEPKKEEPKKAEPKKEEPKKQDPKKDDQVAAKTEKQPSKEDVLAQALKDATKAAQGSTSSSGGTSKDAKGSSKDALADALADLGREVSGRGTSGDGTAEDGPGEGVSTGSLADVYGTRVKDAIRPNWRFPRFSNVALVTTVELKVNKAGDILAARVLNGSGRSDFDASVMRAIEETKQLPPLPETLSATLVINFNSKDF
jgi:colicin import membrane protein